MTIPQLHMYDLKTGEYTGSRDFFGIIGILLVLVLIQARKINYTNIIQVE